MKTTACRLSRRRFLGAASLASLAGGGLSPAFLMSGCASASEAGKQVEVILRDPGGQAGRAMAPVSCEVRLSAAQLSAAQEGRLVLRETSSAAAGPALWIPAQVSGLGQPGEPGALCWLMPPGTQEQRSFVLAESASPVAPSLRAAQDALSGQYDLCQGAQPILRYNYATIEPGDRINAIAAGNRIYARARSNYIHPLYGSDGEPLTYDWSQDHPHHRGIYWAWPEVDWHGQRGDLHALQKVFARPTGHCATTGGPVFAQLEAENLWRWEDQDSIVREQARIRAWRAGPNGRFLDLEFRFTALADDVAVARRETKLYGGLNIRLAKVSEQEIRFSTDPADKAPRQAWAELSGRFPAGREAVGLAVFQHPANPDYPGDWVKYPEINWFQPTFPAAGTRFTLRKDRPLVLRFRLWVHAGQADETRLGQAWSAYAGTL